jgi:hypothetical protein
MLININASAINTTSTAADVQTVTKIQDLSDVDIPVALDNGQLLIWNGSTMNWENSNIVDNDLTVTGNLIPYTLRANVDTGNAFNFHGTFENYGTDIYDTTTRLWTWKDYGSDQVNVHQWFTQEGNVWYRFEASGASDDGSHTSRLTLQGGNGGEITVDNGNLQIYNNNGPLRLLTDGGDTVIQLDSGVISLNANNDSIHFNTGNNFVVQQSNNIEFNTDNNFTVNSGGPFNVYSGGSQLYMENGYGSNIRMTQQIEMVLRESAGNTATGVEIIRHNSDGGSTVNNSTNIQYNFRIKSEDEIVDNIVGNLSASYNDGGNGNRFALLLNDSGNNEVNSVILRETYTTSAQPFAYPNFTQTEINAMSPSNGWVLYNSDTNKLQVYAGGAWVDLH